MLKYRKKYRQTDISVDLYLHMQVKLEFLQLL